MKITDVRVRKITDEGKMKCIVSLTFDNLFVVHDIKVIEGHNRCPLSIMEATMFPEIFTV